MGIGGTLIEGERQAKACNKPGSAMLNQAMVLF